MATIRKRNGRYQVQVRRQGSAPLSRTFSIRKDAEVWAREAERQLERGELPPDARRCKTAFAEVLQRYRDDVTPSKRSARTEAARIGLLLRHPLSKVDVGRITPAMIAGFRDERLGARSSETVRQDLVLIRQVLETARREWGVPILRNPVDDVKKPPPAKPRTRRLREGEIQTLNVGALATRTPALNEVIVFAAATGMRRGEILRVTWGDINWDDATLFIPETKNGQARHIPLSPVAMGILERTRQIEGREVKPFPLSANALRLAWQRLLSRVGIDGLRFHDLRHEAISHFFEQGLSMPEVQLISGHRDVRQLLRYTHLSAVNVSRKLKNG